MSSLVDDVHIKIRDLIIENGLPPDAHINIDALARSLEVSHTPIREALARLEAEHLVVKLPRRGYRTTPLLVSNELNELYDFRIHVERWATERAANNETDDWHQRFAVEAAKIDDLDAANQAGPIAAARLTEHDSAFHRLLVEGGDNQPAVDAMERMHVHLHLFRLHAGRPHVERVLTEHRAIAEAVIRRDSAAAAAAMVTHLSASHDRLRQKVLDTRQL